MGAGGQRVRPGPRSPGRDRPGTWGARPGLRGGARDGREGAGGAAEVVDPSSQAPGQGLPRPGCRRLSRDPPAGAEGSEWTGLNAWGERFALRRDALGLSTIIILGGGGGDGCDCAALAYGLGGGGMFLLQVELCSVSESPQTSSLPELSVGRGKKGL